jgi:hypothetical protein
MGIRKRAETERRAKAMGPTKTGRHSELVARVPRRGFYRLDGLKLWGILEGR